ncbi:folate-binding protein [Alphaproteobacteria bacterium]|nr:folate-binding protein [Alphaproteobacteria bacterium]
MPDEPFFVTLKNRGLIKISGKDRYAFLQGLITNDIEKLETLPSIYACLLTPQGKFLHDFFITENNNELLLDCEGGQRTEDLAKRLTTYKIRANIEITTTPENTVYSIFNSEHGIPDPRNSEIGNRSFEKPDCEEKPFETWDTRRITLTIPDGSRDMIIDKSTLLESNIDKLNGIDFDKGCYIGQELTARMHYRGLAKKHLQTITENIRPFGEEMRDQNGKLIGEMRSSCGDIGIALLKI